MRRFPIAALAAAAVLALSGLPAMAQTAAQSVGQATSSAAAMPPIASSTPGHAKGTPAVMAPVNVNTASEAQLDSVPQIGPKRAAAIIAHRPYKTTDELVSKKALGQATYNKVKSHLTVG